MLKLQKWEKQLRNYSLVSRTAASLLLVGALAACGSSSNPAPEAAAPTTFAVSGTAATGAAFDGATITITGSDGTTYPAAGDPPIVTGTDGSYTITLPLTAKPPFVVTAVKSDISLVSVIAEAKDTTTNITPVTNLIASRLSSSGDPAMLAAEFLKDPKLLDLAKITASVAEVVKLIQPLMTAVGDDTDPLNGNIQAAVTAGTGADKMLDSLSITITPNSATTVNISVAVKQQLADGAQPEVISFGGGANATAPAAALATVDPAKLVSSGNAALIADLLQRMTACYAVAPADRVSTGGTAAADIKATECKDIFFGNDPASYLNNGAIVGKTGAFSGIFGTGVGAVFDLGSYEFTRGGDGATNGDLVIAYRTTNSSGIASYNTLAVRSDADKKLRAIGNQYVYDGGVNAKHELRTFIAQPSSDYYGTGFHLSVNNTLDAAGKSIFAKVLVTSPKGSVLTLVPSAGLGNLVLAKSSGPTRTSFLRISNAYIDQADSRNPAGADTTQFSSPTPATDDEIAGYGGQGSWQFDYYLASDPTTIAATQYYKTRARPLNIAELRTKSFAALADADIATIKASLATNTSGLFLPKSYLPSPVTGPLTVNWVVPAAALPPTVVSVTGGTTSLSYNDSATVASSSRTATVACSLASKADTHCTSGGDFAAGGFSVVQLWASDQTGREFASLHAFYALATPTTAVAVPVQ